MAAPSAKTVQYTDPRIEPQPEPVYEHVIGPTQNQYYKIPASGLSDSSITFNNLTTLGVDRAYLDTFELEITAEFTFTGQSNYVHGADNTPPTGIVDHQLFPNPSDFTFQSFPFNTCCEEARVNINGGAFFSQPMCYVRAKERYMNQYELSKCYENICPIHRPELQYEDGITRNTTDSVVTLGTNKIISEMLSTNYYIPEQNSQFRESMAPGFAPPTRYGRVTCDGYMQSSQGLTGGFNNSIIQLGNRLPRNNGYEKWYRILDNNNAETLQTKLIVTWREPVFCSPFSSRYDATYGRPLYNITSMDLTFNLMDLGNMIRLSTLNAYKNITSYSVHITNCSLCYQVMTIPSILKKPLTTLVPYRRFVPYITDMNRSTGAEGEVVNELTPFVTNHVKISSGVYTLNEIPTAIWVFFAPSKSIYQTNPSCVSEYTGPAAALNGNDHEYPMRYPSWCSNNLFGYLEHIDISLANTTQILNTAKPLDLYRIAKANGCEDSYLSWHQSSTLNPRKIRLISNDELPQIHTMYHGAGSVLRLKPGVDIIIPDIPLIPGANANNMVFQVTADFTVPPQARGHTKYALWLLFEYVGVASISPGQCEITMNPLGSGEIMAASPIVSATSEATEGKLEGSGFWDNVRRNTRIATQIADNGIIAKLLRNIPGLKRAADWIDNHALNVDVGIKRRKGDSSGGAVIGHGLNEWV